MRRAPEIDIDMGSLCSEHVADIAQWNQRLDSSLTKRNVSFLVFKNVEYKNKVGYLISL